MKTNSMKTHLTFSLVAAHPRFDCDLSPKMPFSWTLGRQISLGPLPGSTKDVGN